MVVALLLLAACSSVRGEEPPDLRVPTPYAADRRLGSAARIALSAKRLPAVKELYATAGVKWPPSDLLLRIYKAEGQLEAWAGNGGALRRVATYGICYASGGLGPKRREGDLQVPEGFYTLDLYNPASDYHLAMRVSYPNRSDRILGDPKHPGSAIMIHGDCVSIGCVAMSDERIEEIWQMATAVRDQGKTVQVHMLPARDLDALIASGKSPEYAAFWRNLAEGDAIFRREARAPVVSVAPDGRYTFR
jgi:murein L,D-transpeptidase YafK